MWDNKEVDVLQNILSKDEQIIWSGRPKQGLLLRSSDVFLIPFSLLWGGFALFWEGGVLSSGAPFFFILWGIPFVLMGIYITVGRFFVDAYVRQKTYYGLTKDRAIIVSGLFQQSVKSLTLRTLSDVTISERMDGRGTITFGHNGDMFGFSSAFGNSSWPGAKKQAPPAFEAITDARLVYDYIRDAQRNKFSQ